MLHEISFSLLKQLSEAIWQIRLIFWSQMAYQSLKLLDIVANTGIWVLDDSKQRLLYSP